MIEILDRRDYQATLPALYRLFERSFGKSLGAGFLEWRYLENPVPPVLAAVAREGERVIANYSASPMRMRFGLEGVVTTALSMTTMTDPDHAGKGWFPRLATELYREMEARGIRMVWGFPNSRSHRGFVERLGWRDIYEIPTMHLDLTGRATDPPSCSRDDAFALDYSGVAAAPQPVHVKKDPPLLHWRYRDHPVFDYAVLALERAGAVTAFAIAKTYGEDLDLVDFQAHDPPAVADLLDQVVRHGVAARAHFIHAWAPLHHPLHRACEKQGFVHGEPVTYLGARAFGSAVSTDYADWFLQMGDSDVY